MKRIAYDQLLQWKNSSVRKPLIVKGARQVGKTWLLKHFGQNEYKQVLYVNFELQKNLRNLFKQDFDTQRILLALSIATGINPEPQNTLIILDEIQEAEEGITALKYFYENAPQYHIAVAGSYLGISLHKNYSFPVGKVDFLELQPMNFKEFLWAMQQEKLSVLLDKKDWNLIDLFHTQLIELLKQYFVVGGMPEAVQAFVENKDFEQIRIIQKQILFAYEHDFSKHVPATQIPRIKMIWEHIPAQLSKENKKFFFAHLKKGARAKEFEIALEWLVDSGLIHRIYRITKPGLPLSTYKDYKSFKVFFIDVGLLSALSDLDYRIILQDDKIFKEFKGALSEQYVLQEILQHKPYYWSAGRSKNEVDFIIHQKNNIIPIEVKSGINLKSKSLKVFCQKYQIPKGIRFSLAKHQRQDWLINIPLYLAGMYF